MVPSLKSISPFRKSRSSKRSNLKSLFNDLHYKSWKSNVIEVSTLANSAKARLILILVLIANSASLYRINSSSSDFSECCYILPKTDRMDFESFGYTDLYYFLITFRTSLEYRLGFYFSNFHAIKSRIASNNFESS